MYFREMACNTPIYKVRVQSDECTLIHQIERVCLFEGAPMRVPSTVVKIEVQCQMGTARGSLKRDPRLRGMTVAIFSAHSVYLETAELDSPMGIGIVSS
jgi:hypothetical protein